MIIARDSLVKLIHDIFRAENCSEAESLRIADYLVRSNLAGHDSHGVLRVPRYVGWLRDGSLVRDKTLEIVTDGPSFAQVDGGFGFGQTVAPQAVSLGIEKARASGTAIIALRNSGHIGRVGEWAEMAVEAGLCSVHFVNVAGSELVAPFGGVERRFSTAPFAAGLPMSDAAPIILDFATSLVAEGKVYSASNGGKPIPEDSLIAPDGTLGGDPSILYGPLEAGKPRAAKNGKGAIRAFGDHKGSGLALICELLAGALTGSGCAGPGPRKFANGMLSIYISPSYFGSMEAFQKEAGIFIDYVRSSRPAETGGEILLPGEMERRTAAERTEKGIPLSEETWQSLLDQARDSGLSPEVYA